MEAFLIVLVVVLIYHLLTARHDAAQAAINAEPVPDTLPKLAKETARSGGECLLYAVGVVVLFVLGGLVLMANLAPVVAQYSGR